MFACDRDQFWAEAACREATGQSIRLPEKLWSAAAVEQEARREIDPFEEMLESRLAGGFEQDMVMVEALWNALGDAGSQRKRNDAARLARIMQRRGFVRKEKVTVSYEHGKQQQRWAWVRNGVEMPSSIEIRESVQDEMAF